MTGDDGKAGNQRRGQRPRRVYVRQHLHAAPAGYGLVLGAIGVGGALGPLMLIRLIRDTTRPGWVFGPYALRGGVDLALATAHTLPAAAAALAGYGLGTCTGAVTFKSLLQATVPDQLRGRVMAHESRVARPGVVNERRRPARSEPSPTVSALLDSTLGQFGQFGQPVRPVAEPAPYGSASTDLGAVDLFRKTLSVRSRRLESTTTQKGRR